MPSQSPDQPYSYCDCDTVAERSFASAGENTVVDETTSARARKVSWGTPATTPTSSGHVAGAGGNPTIGWGSTAAFTPEVHMQMLVEVGHLVRAAARRGGRGENQCEEEIRRPPGGRGACRK